MSPGQVAEMYGVDAKTASRWGTSGRLDCVRLADGAGHRRFFRAEVEALLAGAAPEEARAAAGRTRADLGLPPRDDDSSREASR